MGGFQEAKVANIRLGMGDLGNAKNNYIRWMKVLSKQRMGSITGKRLRNYALYALGEIILVVIGILIAVSINNWNEDSKQEKVLLGYLKAYKTDLETDTLIVGRTLQMFDVKAEQFELFLSDSVTAQTYQEHPEGFGLILSYVPFEMQQKGFTLLSNYTNEKEEVTDSLLIDIIANHSFHLDAITSTQKMIKEDIRETMNYFKNNEPWVADLLQGDVSNPEMIAYFTSKQHKGRVAIHEMLVIGNMAAFLNSYKSKAIQTIAAIEERLQEE